MTFELTKLGYPKPQGSKVTRKIHEARTLPIRFKEQAEMRIARAAYA